MIKLLERLGGRLRLPDIREICYACSGEGGEEMKKELFSLINHPEERVGYNALWIFTHFSAPEMKWLMPRRNELIDALLQTDHVGKQRLLLTLLEHQKVTVNDLRTDYLDFCLARINSAEPYAIRAFCLKQAFALCRFYPELMAELENEIELMECGELSPGLLSARRNIRRKISRLN